MVGDDTHDATFQKPRASLDLLRKVVKKNKTPLPNTFNTVTESIDLPELSAKMSLVTRSDVPTSNDSYEQIRSVNRAMTLIEELANEYELGVSTLATRLGTNKATTFRLLSTLRALGYIDQDENSDLYRLNLKLFSIGSKVAGRIETVREARPVMERLSSATGETVHLAIRDGISVVYVDKIDSEHILRMFSRVGNRAPSWCTGLGKALLSGVSDETLDQLFGDKELTRFTPYTITTLAALKEDLRVTASRGYAVDDQEHEPGIHCVAAPLRDHHGSVVAAISISWPETRHTDERLVEFSDLVREHSREASRRIGWESDVKGEP